MISRYIITTECVADLPKSIIENEEIKIIYFDIQTDKGLFRDTVEINSQNVMEYMADGQKKAQSVAPSANDFKKFFAKYLKEYDEIIHICISNESSESFKNASLARAKMGADGSKIHIVDSRTLSGGQALIVLEAIRLNKEGKSSKEIVSSLDEFKKKVSTSFLAESADYLYYNGKVSKNVMTICRFFHLHPVLAMVDGKMTLAGIYVGNYKKAAKKYIKKALGDIKKVDTKKAFFVNAGCDHETTLLIRDTVGKKVKFDTFYEQQASATVSSNCGPNTFGILFVRKD